MGVDVHVDTVKCMAGSDADCRLVMIRHTFRTPLEFSVVSTIVWDDRRNAWQSTFNHGVHVTGESLNARHGIPVNDGNLAACGTELFEGILEEERRIAADQLVKVDLLNLLRSAADEQPQ